MPRRSIPHSYDFHAQRFTQISESHCGPAVIQMLLSHLGFEVSQEEVAEAGGATALIELQSMRVDQLAAAVRLLAPQVRFWQKDHATIEDLVTLVSKYRYPVGVEWQGVFEDEDEEDDDDDDEDGDEDDEDDEEDEEESETNDPDYGHYSIVTYINRRKQELIIADPYKDYISQDRIFTFEEFEGRWWDFNEISDPVTGLPRLVEDYHMLFIVTPRRVTFPLKLGLRRA